MPKCIEKDCNTYALFNIKGEKNGKYCLRHKTLDMINVCEKRKCSETECNSLNPSFNYPTEKKGIYCGSHKKDGMINIIIKTCKYENCIKSPSYGFKDSKCEYCSEHKLNNMIYLKKICAYKGCNKQPSFNLLGYPPLYCLNHKEINMINVLDLKRLCQYNSCNIRANFNYSNETHGIYCKKHKEDNMINVEEKRVCNYKGCNIQPSYNLPTEKIAIYCKNHKTKDMINIKAIDICQYENCKLRSSYNIKGILYPKYCSKHKEDNMINIYTPYCDYINCNNLASFGIPGIKRIRCSKHKINGMIKSPNKKCVVCKESATFGINLIPKHCEKHKEENEQNLMERKCSKCNLIMILDKNNLCEYCNPITFRKVQLSKQNALMNYLDSINLNGDSTDKIVNNGECGKERPDRIFDFADKIIILECDENQHKDRNSECELTRMINIGQSFGGIPVYFIRWNPDTYISNNKIETVNKRYKLLGDFINSIKSSKIVLPKALLSAFYMYYDNWNDFNNEKWKILMNYD